MAKPLIDNIVTTNTFQTWLDRTNEVIGILRTDVITASVLGDVTGTLGAPLSAALIGTFSANTVIAQDLFRTDTISPKVGSSAISVTAPVTITSSTQNAESYVNISGPRNIFDTGTVSWRVGFDDAITNNFIIDTGIGTRKFSVTPSGAVTTAGAITAPTFNGNIAATTGTVATLTSNAVTANTANITTLSSANSTLTTTNITTATVGALTVSGTATINTNLTLNGTTRNLYVNSNPASGNGIRLNNSGSLSVIDFTQEMRFRNGAGSTTYLTIATNGNLTAAGDITAFSDESLKTDIVQIGNALDKVSSLRGVSFKRIDQDDNKTHIGVIAQEIEKILPEVVTTNSDGIKTVAYGNITGLLIEAIKELKEEIDTLKGA